MPAPFLDPNLATAAMAALSASGGTGTVAAQQATTVVPVAAPTVRNVDGTRVITQHFTVTGVGLAEPKRITVIQLLPESGAVAPRFKRVPVAITCPEVGLATETLPLGAVAGCVPIPPAALAVKPVAVSPLRAIGLKADC